MGLIPKTGAWVLIRTVIPVAIPVDPLSLYYALPTGKLFWEGENEWRGRFHQMGYESPGELMARLDMKWSRFEDFKQMIYDFYRSRKAEEEIEIKRFEELEVMDKNGLISEDVIEQQLKIKTPFGDVYIQPHEYSVVKNMTEYIEPVKDGHAFIRYLTESKQLSGKIADQVFYLRSRGISFSEAITLCVQNVKTQNLFYIELHPEYQKAFTRGFDEHWAKKLVYCVENKRQDLLNYGPHWDFSNYELGTKRKPSGKGSRKSKRVAKQEGSDTARAT